MANQHTNIKKRLFAPAIPLTDEQLNQQSAEKAQRPKPMPEGLPPEARKPKEDPNFAHLLRHSNADLDKMQADLDALRAARGYPKIESGRDAHDKQFDAHEDLEFDPLGTMDPLTQLKHAYERPGFALKLMSNRVNQHLGRRGYQVVKDTQGDPVMCGTMILGEIPEKIAAQRRATPIRVSNDELKAINEQQAQQIDKLRDEAKGLGLTVLKPGEVVTNRGDGQDYAMGISVSRGEGPAD